MIYLAREGSQLGSFSPEEIREGLRRGRFLPDDFFFTDGMSEWRPLCEWESAPPPAPRPTRSLRVPVLLGCGALLVGAVVLVVLLGLFALLRPSSPSEPFPQTLALFRIGMLHDWKATVHRYGDEEVQRQFASWSVDIWNPLAPEVGWSYWFDTAVFTGVDLGSAHPRTAFYHPWSDTFWLAEWDLSGRARITKAWFGAGDVLRSGGRPPWDPTPLWLRGRGARADALAAALAVSIPAAERALERRSWPDDATRKDPTRAVNATLCRVSLLELLTAVEPLRRSVEGEGAALTALRAELQSLRRRSPASLTARFRDAPENSVAMRTALGAFPSSLGASLQPVCRLGAGRTAMVVLMSSQTSDFALATVWDMGPGRARLLRVDVLPFADLMKAARAQK